VRYIAGALQPWLAAGAAALLDSAKGRA
jgi:hypothetical protein